MKNPIKILLIAFILAAGLLAGCSGGAGGANAADGASQTGGTNAAGEQGGSSGQPGGPAALQRDVLNTYSAEFQIQFTGVSSWVYQLKARKSPEQREVSLHLDGLDAARNPGDIRLVSDAQQSWMVGPGTDNECVQFPNNQGMDPSFLYPETLVDVTSLGEAVQLVGEEQAADIPEAGAVTLQHFRASGLTVGAWRNAVVDYWVDKASGMLYRFTLQGEGEDPFFGAGAGRIAASYRVSGLGDAPIEAVSGCEIGVKLPESAANFVRLPGMASFDSAEGVEAVQAFYQGLMPQENWTESQPPAQQDGATVLSYQRDSLGVQIFIEAASTGSKVKLIFIQ